jgi:hypothetical protein
MPEHKSNFQVDKLRFDQLRCISNWLSTQTSVYISLIVVIYSETVNAMEVREIQPVKDFQFC